MSDITSSLRNIFAHALLSDESQISIDQPYVDMGVDSILAIQISNLINLKFNTNLKPEELFNFTDIASIALFLEQKKAPSKKRLKIAIVGMAGTFPEAADTVKFRKNLQKGHNALSKSTRWQKKVDGGFLNNIKSFDAQFFGISPKEARCMDPQQRLFLEIAWQAFHDAGYTKTSLDEQECGVYVGSLPGDYKDLIAQSQLPLDSHSFLGNATSVIAGRVAYCFNLKGPVVSLDTACSSSLVAISLACDALENRSCSLAIAGGVSIFSTPQLFELSKGSNLLSKTGKCSPFDAKANGFVPSEGVGAFVLKRLEDAKKENCEIYAVIEATGIQHDGRSNGIASPNSSSQSALIKKIYQRSEIEPTEIGYVETHGTGTPIGDPIEVKGLLDIFSDSSPYIGSCKQNIGHCLTASGCASLMKTVFSLQDQMIYPQRGIEHPIPLGSLKIVDKLTPWPKKQPLAAINSFGFSGTNCHIVVSRYEESPQKPLLAPPEFNKTDYWIESSPNKKNAHSSSDTIRKKLRIQLADILEYNPDSIGYDVPLSELGVDSLVSIQLLEPFEQEFGSLPSNLAVTHPTLQKISDYLCGKNPTSKQKNKEEWALFLPPLNTTQNIWIQQKRYFAAKPWNTLFPEYTETSMEKQLEQIIKKIHETVPDQQPVHWIGWSLGGCLALLAALQEPKLVKSLTIIGAAPSYRDELFGETLLLREELEEKREYISKVYKMENISDPSEPFTARCSLNQLKTHYEELEAFDIRDRIKQINQPTLIIHGDQDPVVNSKDVKILSEIPNSRILKLPYAGHFAPLLQPSSCNQAITKHIS